MTVVTTRPNSTDFTNGWVRTGGTTAHGVLSDDSDATYMQSSDLTGMQVNFPTPVIPGTGKLTGVVWRARTRRVNGNTARVTFTPTFAFMNDSTLVITWPQVTTTALGGVIVAIVPAAAKHELNFYKKSGDADARIFEVYLDWTYVAQPTTVPVVQDGVSPITDNTNPEVVWTNTLDADGGGQSKYQVKIFTDAVYLGGGFDPATSAAYEDSGEVSSSIQSWTPNVPQVDDTYRAYVRVAQSLVTGETHWSPWAFDEYTVTVSKPAVPTLALTSEPTFARIKIDLTGNAGPATTDKLQLERLLPGGDWEPVRTGEPDGIETGTSATIYDYEVPNGTTATYRTRAIHLYGDFLAFSAWSATADSSWSSADVWLKHPTKPSLSRKMDVYSQPGYERDARQTIFLPLGRTDPVVVSDTRLTARGEIVFSLDTKAIQDGLDLLLDDNVPLLLQMPTTHNWPDRWVMLGTQARARYDDKLKIEPTLDAMSWVEVSRPAGELLE